jgi:hypothetical protein
LDSVYTITLFWVRIVQQIEYINRENALWSWRGMRSTRSSTKLEYFFDFIRKRSESTQVGSLLAVVGILIARFAIGLRPFKTWSLLIPVVTGIAAAFLEPPPIRYGDWERSLKHKLIFWLNLTRARSAELPSDKVFALYGVLSNLGVPLEPPDY